MSARDRIALAASDMAAASRTARWVVVAAMAAAVVVSAAAALHESVTRGAEDAEFHVPPVPVIVTQGDGAKVVAPTVASSPAIVREIRVLVACDEEFRRRRNWRNSATALVRLASIPWEREFGIRWTPVECVDWVTDDAAPTMQDLQRRLAETASFESAEVVLGLTGQWRPRRGSAAYEALGVSDCFGRAAVVGIGQPGCEGREPNAVAHEFGHLLGAWHCAEANTIMTAPSTDLTRFDPQTRALIPLVRQFDFRAGRESLDRGTVDAITALWKAGHASDAMHPVAQSFLVRGWARVLGGLPESGAPDLEKALEVLASCGVTKGAHVASCLVGLGQSYSRRVALDPTRELEYARRARAAAGDEVEDPVAASWMLLGHALWANGSEEESIEAYAQALKLRSSRCGIYHSDTIDARASLEWFAARGSARANAVRANGAGSKSGGGRSSR